MDQESGRLLILHADWFHRVEPDGELKIMKHTETRQEFMRKRFAVTLDLAGTGVLLAGSNDLWLVLDEEGNIIERNDFKGPELCQIYLCTLTASMDPCTSLGDFLRFSFHRFEDIREQSKKQRNQKVRQ